MARPLFFSGLTALTTSSTVRVESHTGNTGDVTRSHTGWFTATAAALLIVLLIELIIPAKGQSATHDEGAYVLSGYSYWTRADFGLNPEHPPLSKLLISLPLLRMPLHYPSLPGGFFKHTEFAGGREFLYSNDADAMLVRARMATVTLTLAAALLSFAVAYQMFGGPPALLALLLFVFEPNLISHGSLANRRS